MRRHVLVGSRKGHQHPEVGMPRRVSVGVSVGVSVPSHVPEPTQQFLVRVIARKVVVPPAPGVQVDVPLGGDGRPVKGSREHLVSLSVGDEFLGGSQFRGKALLELGALPVRDGRLQGHQARFRAQFGRRVFQKVHGVLAAGGVSHNGEFPSVAVVLEIPHEFLQLGAVPVEGSVAKAQVGTGQDGLDERPVVVAAGPIE
mmetsp:Transcript_19023/g.43985  ORF Transcript_19023/g.43985 Transcript_19023/m.43985 type:complete len:200 (-) Transcript_19023:369-968(-)